MIDTMTTTLAQTVTPWFDNPGLVGGLLGAGVGVLGGGIYGPLVGICASRGIARRFVVGYHWLLVVLGVIVASAGIVALATGQPYGVWYSLLLPGLLLSVLMLSLTPVLLMRYRQAEHRRLTAEEFRRA